MVYGASTVLSAWLATLHKDRFIERQLGTTALPQDWNGPEPAGRLEDAGGTGVTP